MLVSIEIITTIGGLFFIIWSLIGDYIYKDQKKNYLFLAGVALFMFALSALKFVVVVNFFYIILAVVWFVVALISFATAKIEK